VTQFQESAKKPPLGHQYFGRGGISQPLHISGGEVIFCKNGISCIFWPLSAAYFFLLALEKVFRGDLE
jgi:hypothetical protein